MIRFFKICGVISFLGVVTGLSLVFSSAMSDSLSDMALGLSLAFFSFACGMLFLTVAKLSKRIDILEGRKQKNKEDQNERCSEYSRIKTE